MGSVMGQTRRLVYISFLVATGLLLHFVEGMIGQISTMIPGVKLGLANIVTLVTLVLLGPGDAVWVAALRALLGSLFSGRFLSLGFYMSFFGGLMSAIVMGVAYVLLPGFFSLFGISVLGAVAHNLTQLLIFYIWSMHLGVFLYAPYLILIAIPTGLGIGLVVTYIIGGIKRGSWKSYEDEIHRGGGS